MARNAGALALARGATMLLKLGVAARLTRVLDPEGFGVLGYGLALLAFFGLIGTLGLDVLGTREAARSPERAADLAARVVGLRLALASAAYAVYGVVLVLLPVGPAVRVVLLVQGALLLVQALDVQWLYSGLERMGPVAVRNVFADVLQLVCVLVFVREPEHLLRAAAIATGTAAVVAGGMWASYRRDFGPLRPRVDLAAWRALLRPALPLAASALMVTIYYTSDRLFLGWLRGPADVGHYEAAYRLMGVVLAPSQILYQAFFPSLSKGVGDLAEMQAGGRAFARVTVAVGMPLAALVGVCAVPLIEWFAGADYAPAAAPLAVLMVASGVIYINIVFGQSLLAWDAHRPYVEAVVAGAVVNLLLNPFVIPAYGPVGAAWTTVAAEVTALVRVAFAYRHLTGELPWPALARALAVASVGTALPAWALLRADAPLFVVLAAGGACAVAASVAVGTVRLRDIAALKARMGKR